MIKLEIKILVNDEKHERSFSGKSITIGRAADCDFPIKDPALSRHHCLIEFQDGSMFITDLDSANGVFINGRRITPYKKTPYYTFLPLALGTYKCEIFDSERSFTGLIRANPSQKKRKFISPQQPIPQLPAKDGWRGGLRSHFYVIFLMTIIIVASAAIVYNRKSPQIDNAYIETPLRESPTPSALEKVSAPEIKLPREIFSPLETYKELSTRKTCSGYEFVCANLGLSAKRGEGVLFSEDMRGIYIFVQSSKYGERETTQTLRALKVILESEIYMELLKARDGKIYLVLLNPSGKPQEVVMTSFSHYDQTFSRSLALQYLESAISSEDPTQFWKGYRPYFPVREF